MAKQTKPRKTSKPRPATPAARDLWLATIGAVSLGRKQGAKLYDSVLAEGRTLQGRFEQGIAEAGEQINAAVASVRQRADAIVSPLRSRAEETLVVVKGEVEARLQPVLARLGVKKAPAKRRPAAKRPVRKPVAKRAPAKRKAA